MPVDRRVTDADIVRHFLTDREGDVCRCPSMPDGTDGAYMRHVLRRVFPAASDCPQEISDALMQIGSDDAQA